MKDYQGDKLLELNKRLDTLLDDVKFRDGLLLQMASEVGGEVKRLRKALTNIEEYHWERWEEAEDIINELKLIAREALLGNNHGV